MQITPVSFLVTSQRGPYHAALLEKQVVLIFVWAALALHTAMHSCAILQCIEYFWKTGSWL